MRRVLLASAMALGCGGPPQTQRQAAVLYRAAFHAEPGASTKVVFPWIADGTSIEALQNLKVTSDGGSFAIEQIFEGQGLAVQGLGDVVVEFSGTKVTGLEGDKGIPQARLTLQVADGGVESRYLKVNKAGSATVQVEFEYKASRDCGSGCGGTRDWSYTGSVGLALQTVDMTFSEAKR